MKTLRRFLPLLLIIVAAVTVRMLGWTEYLSFEELKRHRGYLLSLVQQWPFLAALAYMLLYTITTALSIPGGAALSIFGGFLFGQPFATLYVVFAATLGATIIFLAAKTSIGDLLRDRAGSGLRKIENKIRKDAVYYLLFMRLVPLFPFWLVNLAPAFVGVALSTFVWTTAVGIIPGAFVFTQAGAGVGSLLDMGETPSLGSLLTIEIRIALVALGLFVLIPVVYKWWRSREE